MLPLVVAKACLSILGSGSNNSLIDGVHIVTDEGDDLIWVEAASPTTLIQVTYRDPQWEETESNHFANLETIKAYVKAKGEGELDMVPCCGGPCNVDGVAAECTVSELGATRDCRTNSHPYPDTTAVLDSQGATPTDGVAFDEKTGVTVSLLEKVLKAMKILYGSSAEIGISQAGPDKAICMEPTPDTITGGKDRGTCEIVDTLALLMPLRIYA